MATGRPRRAVKKEIPSGSSLSYKDSQISSCWEDVLDSEGRASPLKEEAGNTVIMIVLKKVE